MKNSPKLTDIAALQASQPSLDNFGPESLHPYLAFDLGVSDASLQDWLKSLPCPTIGIGNGALSSVCDVVLGDARKLKPVKRNIEKAPMAAMVLMQHLRASEHLSLEDALTAESFAYAAVQAGPEFKNWLESYEGKDLPKFETAPVLIETDKANMTLTMNRAQTRNAIGTEMRDALCEALDLALTLPGLHVTLNAEGTAFSTGGAIEEFGQVSDPATAHWIRSLRFPAWRLARLKNRLSIHLNGAAIGAGAEIAAFGSHVSASSKAWFQLPELKYGLIPGAGGTASLPRRIGRQRTAYMALSMEKIRAETALAWGLIDNIID